MIDEHFQAQGQGIVCHEAYFIGSMIDVVLSDLSGPYAGVSI